MINDPKRGQAKSSLENHSSNWKDGVDFCHYFWLVAAKPFPCYFAVLHFMRFRDRPSLFPSTESKNTRNLLSRLPCQRGHAPRLGQSYILTPGFMPKDRAAKMQELWEILWQWWWAQQNVLCRKAEEGWSPGLPGPSVQVPDRVLNAEESTVLLTPFCGGLWFIFQDGSFLVPSAFYPISFR